MSLSIEALLGFPQMLSNHRTKSVEGLSMGMIGSWVIGDAFKTVYFILEVTIILILESTIAIHFVWIYSTHCRFYCNCTNIYV